jgi:hypothetical protein
MFLSLKGGGIIAKKIKDRSPFPPGKVPERESEDTIVIYGAKRAGNHHLMGYFHSLGEKCEFRHEAAHAKKLFLQKGKQLIILVRNPEDQIISNTYSIFNADKDGYDVGTKDRPLTELAAQAIPYQVVGQACEYLKEFTDKMITLTMTFPFQFVLYDTIIQNNLNSIYTQRDPQYYKNYMLNYDGILTMLANSDIIEYCLTHWRAYNLQQTIYYPELANVRQDPQ